jgi:4-diphosphocytidyl-2-C-methyl-D-erythritol kinase
MIAFPPCKINLGLYITEKRSDGYHNLETCFYPLPFSDILEIIPSARLEFLSSGLPIPGNTKDNLCLRAYALLKNDFDIPPVNFHLHKMIPTGAGLGGGSSDASHTLRLLNDIFELNLSNEMLKGYASRVGSDCAFFIEGRPMIGRGKGDELIPCSVDLQGWYLVLVKPDNHVSTADAYAGITPKKIKHTVREIVERVPVVEWSAKLQNNFEESVFLRHPLIAEIKRELYRLGATYACMTGSGSTVAALFDKPLSQTTIRDVSILWKGVLPSLSSES